MISQMSRARRQYAKYEAMRAFDALSAQLLRLRKQGLVRQLSPAEQAAIDSLERKRNYLRSTYPNIKFGQGRAPKRGSQNRVKSGRNYRTGDPLPKRKPDRSIYAVKGIQSVTSAGLPGTNKRRN